MLDDRFYRLPVTTYARWSRGSQQIVFSGNLVGKQDVQFSKAGASANHLGGPHSPLDQGQNHDMHVWRCFIHVDMGADKQVMRANMPGQPRDGVFKEFFLIAVEIRR